MEVKDSYIKYPVGIQTFAKLREGGYLYVDKTPLVFELIRGGGYYFLSRPRRFGKSLLLSTLEAYYQGRRDLFKGLALDSLTDEWETHPVLHLDLNNENYKDESALINFLSYKLAEWEEQFDIPASGGSVSLRFGEVIKRAAIKSGRKVVVLIDEYDKPLLETFGNSELEDVYRSTLKAFYGTLKSADQYIQMAMLTGVARFNKVSIFSDLNNLRDISFENKFAEICGITSGELVKYFSDSMRQLSAATGLSYEEVREQLRTRYDGYHFTDKSTDIYNPFSLINVFAANAFRSYWYESGTPTFLEQIIKKGNYLFSEISNYKIDAQTLLQSGIMSGELIPTLYQTGYLTIKSYDFNEDLYTLGYPNREVKEILQKLFTHRSEFQSSEENAR